MLKSLSSSIIVTVLGLYLAACQLKPVDPSGTWRGSVKNPSGEDVAFTLEIKREGDRIDGALVNGDERTPATGGSFDGRTLKLRFDYYDGELTAAISGDALQGTFDRQWRKQRLTRELRATRARADERPAGSPAAGGPADLTGEWVLQAVDSKRQDFWRADFKQQGREVRGTIIPVSGDWGEIVGTFENHQLRLNRFDGINSRVVIARLTSTGRLEGWADLGLFDPKKTIIGERLTAQSGASIATLPDPNRYTRMSNPAEPLRFSFPGLDGKTVSSTDARFKDKVVVVSITGSWCPNCHEEAPLLQEFYRRYQGQGLEAVALGFEYTGEGARDLAQLQIFANRHHLTYPVLLAGSLAEGEIQRRLPQLVNFGAYPTTIFIGRDGLVKRIHTGFEGRATGERFTKLKAEYEEWIKELLADRELS
ncbi:MAG TPA: TlpA disulfide reductase family protein [Blastocatellia bacterium]|nr:TlpA disulfide reductase family protein [Blastocatellia bacterium]